MKIKCLSAKRVENSPSASINELQIHLQTCHRQLLSAWRWNRQVFCFFVVATHALIVPPPPLIFPLELREERTNGSITGHLNSALADVFMAFNCISRTFLGTQLKWNPLVIPNHIHEQTPLYIQYIHT